MQTLRDKLELPLEPQSFHLLVTGSKLGSPQAATHGGQNPAIKGHRTHVTSESLMHIFSCQPSSGGDSGRNTQSAPQAKALTRARYLFGNSTDSVRLRPGTHSSETALGSLDTSVQQEPRTPAGVGVGGSAPWGTELSRGHPSCVYTYVPTVSPHNLENKGPLVAGKETKERPTYHPWEQHEKQRGKYFYRQVVQKACFMMMAGT